MNRRIKLFAISVAAYVTFLAAQFFVTSWAYVWYGEPAAAALEQHQENIRWWVEITALPWLASVMVFDRLSDYTDHRKN